MADPRTVPWPVGHKLLCIKPHPIFFAGNAPDGFDGVLIDGWKSEIPAGDVVTVIATARMAAPLFIGTWRGHSFNACADNFKSAPDA